MDGQDTDPYSIRVHARIIKGSRVCKPSNVLAERKYVRVSMVQRTRDIPGSYIPGLAIYRALFFILTARYIASKCPVYS